MAKNTPKFDIELKMSDFLLGLAYGPHTSLGMKRFTRATLLLWATLLKFCRGRYGAILPHTILQPTSDCIFTPSDICAKFCELSGIPSPSETAFLLHVSIMSRHGSSVPWKLTIFIIKHRQGLRDLLTKFEGDMVNLLGVIHKNIAPETSCSQ